MFGPPDSGLVPTDIHFQSLRALLAVSGCARFNLTPAIEQRRREGAKGNSKELERMMGKGFPSLADFPCQRGHSGHPEK